MNRRRLLAVATFTVVATVFSTQVLSAEQADQAKRPDAVPEGMHGFSGLLVGQVVSKDDEQGELVLRVQQIKRVWRGNKAQKPESGVGKSLLIDGIAGKWLDTLLVLKPGDTVEIEARHLRAARLNFLGEGFKKVAPLAKEQVADKDRPATDRKQTPQLPAGVRGFNGQVRGVVLKKGANTISLKVAEVTRVWETNRAERPKTLAGMTVTVTPRRTEEGTYAAAHVRFMKQLQVGQQTTLEVQNRRGARFFITELTPEQRGD